MRKDRQVFEQRIREYKERARNALEAVNNMVELFNSYGAPFGVWHKHDFQRNLKDGYISSALAEKLNRYGKTCPSPISLRKRKYRYGLIEEILTERVGSVTECFKAFGRLMDYDPETFTFKLDKDKLDRAALRHADDPDD